MTVGAGDLCDFAVSGDAASAEDILSSVLLFPFYVGWKLLVSLGGRPQQWIRTAREPHR